ncbi:heat shock protein 30C-like [Bufo gargarizans]|uniref:heat shock protein 30C-like n=1 Tax=Bufo gargarizans TaxID=30331 RepID=UPI001CF13BA6|nr:heat shock protein 30C-like [Bufo gargarizans]
MFPLRFLQSSYRTICVCREPALTLRPATQLIFGLLEDDRMSMRKDMERKIQLANQAYQRLAQDMKQIDDLTRSSAASGRNPSTTGKEENENFELTLDVSGFSPEELTVKTECRRLIVSGKHDKKKEAENGGYFHEYREWRREDELPQDVHPEDILCSVSKDGQLHFKAPRMALPAAEERTIPITQSPGDGEENPLEIQTSDPEGENGLNSS